MIVPARAFLILMVPLLLHGALAGLPHAPASGGDKNLDWLNPPLPPPPPEPTNHARITYDDTLPKHTCLLPEGTTYRTGPNNVLYKPPENTLRVLRIATTPQGIMIDIPARSIIYISADPNLIVLPVSAEKNRIQLHSIQTTCVLPVHTKYTVKSTSNKLCDLERPKKYHYSTPRSNWVAYTKKGPLLLPAGSTILLSDDPNYMDLPVYNTEIRIVSQEHRDEVEDFCHNIHKNYVPPHGMLSERWEPYMLRCRHINMWLVGHTQLMEVEVKPMANMVQLSA